MGLGVLEDHGMEHVPGTAFVLDDASRPVNVDAAGRGLKYDTSGSQPVILVPQPSDDPNDPLVRRLHCCPSLVDPASRIGRCGSVT